MNLFYWIFTAYAMVSLFETVKTGKTNAHLWEANKGQFIIVILITLILGGLKGVVDFLKYIISLFQRLIDKMSKEG